jgi:hypothetical protein
MLLLLFDKSHVLGVGRDAPLIGIQATIADLELLTKRLTRNKDVAHLPAVYPNTERIQRIMRAAPRPEPIRDPKEAFLVDRMRTFAVVDS